MTRFDCPQCGATVVRTILRGQFLLVDADPHPEGDLELCGTGMLARPVAIQHFGELPGIFTRYRPHATSCTALVPA